MIIHSLKELPHDGTTILGKFVFFLGPFFRNKLNSIFYELGITISIIILIVKNRRESIFHRRFYFIFSLCHVFYSTWNGRGCNINLLHCEEYVQDTKVLKIYNRFDRINGNNTLWKSPCLNFVYDTK